MSNSKNIYPDQARNNNFSPLYCEMAMESYTLAFDCYEKIKDNNYNIDLYYVEEEMYKHCISTIVFAAMTLESFFNDYAASCLGDDGFYDNFDKLSVISKFQLIAKFILNVEIDKSKSYYSHLVSLNKLRNDYVHNKSSEFIYPRITQEMLDLNRERYDGDIVDIEEPTLNRKAIDKDFQDANNAIKAIRDIAYFFDENDDSIQAVNRLFHIYTIKYAPERISDYIKTIVKDFNIKAVK